MLLTSPAFAVALPKMVRWTGTEDPNAELTHVLGVLKNKGGVTLGPSDFLPVEERDLAHSHFKMLVQQAAGIPIDNQTLRLWTDLKTGAAIQVEANVAAPPPSKHLLWGAGLPRLSAEATTTLVRAAVARDPEDGEVRGLDWKDEWHDGDLVRVVKARGRRGVHRVLVSLSQGRVIAIAFREFPQADAPASAGGDLSLPVQIYPIYEEYEGGNGTQSRVSSELRYLSPSIIRASSDPYAPLRTRRYLDDKMDPIQGLTPEGQAKGFWAMSVVNAEARDLLSKLPLSANGFSDGGMFLEGRYTTVNLYPDVAKQFKGIAFTPSLSPQFMPSWEPRPDDSGKTEMIPSATLRGRPLASAGEAWSRPARRLADHNPVAYLNDGFDEIQVYWAVTQLFESLRPMGFTDPDLSTRRFNAFLYDNDISYRDNAFYINDTINFTTYSPSEPNFARDNTTIWHELGHGVMDRLMGDEIQLADTGGLSEGMADFIAQLVINDVTGGHSFPGKEMMRIFNHTGFSLTNEVHDDGEAYGGSMNDILEAAMTRWGHAGLIKVTDVTLETMRLTRNHPGLTANDWFAHMLFADERGNLPVREPGELRAMILSALQGRNFNLDGTATAEFRLSLDSPSLVLATEAAPGPSRGEIVAGKLGSRDKPVAVPLGPGDTASYQLRVSLKSSPTYAFRYPVTVEVALNGGPLQGAVHWVGEEKGPLRFQLAKETEMVPFALTVSGRCDEANRPDGTCVDYAYVRIWNAGETDKPQAKKRFYVHVLPRAH